MLLNVAMFDAPPDLATLLRLAQSQSAKDFVGVPLSGSELDFVLAKLRHAYCDGAAWLVGGRQRRVRVRSRTKKPRATSSWRRSSP